MKINKPEVEAAICNPTVDALMKRLHADADLAHKRGYSAYSAVLTNFATRIEKARSEALDELEAL